MKRFPFLAAFVLAGCIPTAKETPGDKPPVDVSAYTLAAEPAGAKGVVAVRDEGEALRRAAERVPGVASVDSHLMVNPRVAAWR